MTNAIARPPTRVHGALYVTPEMVPGTGQPVLTFNATKAATWPDKAEARAAGRDLLGRGYRVVALPPALRGIGPESVSLSGFSSTNARSSISASVGGRQFHARADGRVACHATAEPGE